MYDDKVICVTTFSNQLDADLAKALLETNGVESFTSSDDCGGARPFMQMITGVRLMVLEREALRASELLKVIKQQDG